MGRATTFASAVSPPLHASGRTWIDDSLKLKPCVVRRVQDGVQLEHGKLEYLNSKDRKASHPSAGCNSTGQPALLVKLHLDGGAGVGGYEVHR